MPMILARPSVLLSLHRLDMQFYNLDLFAVAANCSEDLDVKVT